MLLAWERGATPNSGEGLERRVNPPFSASMPGVAQTPLGDRSACATRMLSLTAGTGNASN
jgi:hypothetical protein